MVLIKTKACRVDVELWEKYRETRNLELRNKILTEYMDIVVFNARRMSSVYKNKEDIEDIINQGVLALIECIERYDWTRGVQFDSYASIRVRGSIIDYMRKQDWVPREIRKKAREIGNACEELRLQKNAEPTDEEIAERVGLGVTEYNEVLVQSHSFNMLSYEELLQDNNESFEETGIEQPEQLLVKDEFRSVIAASIDTLGEKERLIVTLYYFEELKFKEIAAVLGITASRVSQLHSKALLKMQKAIEEYRKN